jgi:formyl-CoA transferase
VADIAAGMYAYSGILTALLARASHGRGAAVDVSLFDALGEWMSAPAYYAMYGGRAPERSGPAHASIAPYGPVKTQDGAIIYIGVQNETEWARLCNDVLRRPDLSVDQRFATNPARVANRTALDALITAVTTTLTAGELVERLDRAQIAHARMSSMADFVAHPQLAARGRWREVGSPAGPLKALAPPVQVDAAEPAMGPIPALGAHTDAILAELNVDRDQIAAWRREGTI